MRQRRTELKRRNHLGTYKCQNPISAPLAQDKSYTVRRGLHMFPWGSSGSHYGNERGQITRYRSLGEAGTKSWCSILWPAWLDKRLKPAQFPLQASYEHIEDDRWNIPLVHICVILFLQIMLLCCRSEITAPSLTFSLPWHLPHETLRFSSPASYLITCQHIITISPSWHGTELIPSALRVTTTAEGYVGRQFVCVFQWVSIPSERMLHHCRYRSLQTISQMLIEVIKAAASRGNRCRWWALFMSPCPWR